MIILRSGTATVEANNKNCVEVYAYKPLETCPALDTGIARKFGFGICKTTVVRSPVSTETETHIVYLYESEVDEMYADIASFWEKYIGNTNTIRCHQTVEGDNDE